MLSPQTSSLPLGKIRKPIIRLVVICLLGATLLAVAFTQVAAAADTCTTGALPEGNGGDLIVMTGTCIVHAGTYKYHNVNIYGGGTLMFMDEPGGIDFWAESILIENNGSLIAGAAGEPFGVNGTLTIHLWGHDQGTSGTGGQGITCQSSPTCGVLPEIWKSNSAMKLNPSSCTRVKDVIVNGKPYGQNLPGNVDDCFYGYEPITYDRAGTPPGFFGYKVLAVSYGGTLQLFGKKGAVADPQPANNSGSSWARLTTTLAGTGSENQFTIDRKVDWVAQTKTTPGDQIVVTTTDYLPGHSELLTIKAITTTDTSSTITTVENIKYPHYGQVYPLTGVPSTIGPDPGQQNRSVDTRAAVGLLRRSIRIVSGGETLLSNFPALDPNCGAPPKNPCYYFGGHTIFRQGFQSVQLRGVEFYQMGQGGRIMHYPVHFHMARRTPQPASPTDPPVTFIEDSSVWDSMTRWMTLHASQGVTLARNVGYLSIGHGYYLEDATETDNKLYSNLGVFARAAVINPQNPRQVPGILAAPYPDPSLKPPPPVPPQEAVPFHSDIDHPTVFWMTNGWNDFEYNMAAGAGTCGACYWFVPAANSTMSRYEKWWSYASEQAWGTDPKNSLARAEITPMQKFVGNTCTTAMNSFNTIGDTGPCYGVVRQENLALPRMLPVTYGSLAPDPLTDPSGSDKYYPQVDRGGGRFATKCPDGAFTDCSQVIRCDSTHEDACMATVLDHYTTSFSWTETNFAAIWLRPQWYLLSNSAITDAQNGALTFVTGGGYTESDTVKGHWAIARNDVFIGNTQPATGNPYASNAGPFNPDTLMRDPNFTCAKQPSGATAGNYCLNVAAGVSLPISNFGANQRMFSIYDGPAYEENNAFLDTTETKITDCPATGGNCTASKWMYGQVFGLPKDAKGQCYMPNAAIAWKQPNGFFYPPAFHSNNLFFRNVDIRHFVIEPLFVAGTYNTNDSAVNSRYCTYIPGHQFDGFTDIDRQTELDDDDGSLTGLIGTISVNKDPFFAAPVEDIECASDVPNNMPPVCKASSETCGTAKTSPYGYVTTVVYPDCGENCPQLPKDAPDYLHFWAVDCTNPKCYGVPLYREFLNKGEQGKPAIRMAGQAIAQRSTLTVNHGSYYMDTTVSEETQRRGLPDNLVNVFKGGETYYTFLLFAKPKLDDPNAPPPTKQTYQMYVGKTGFDPDKDVFEITADISSLPIEPQHLTTWDWEKPKYDADSGFLTVTIDTSFATFKDNYNKVAKEHCQPRPNFCSWNDGTSSCGCALSSQDSLYPQCQAVCSSWTNKDVDCPSGGCYGFGVKFPDDFVANGQAQPPTPQCYPNNSDWNTPFDPASKEKAQSCYYSTVPSGSFCSGMTR